MNRITHFVGGKPWTGSPAARQGEVFDPATGTVTGHVDLAAATEVDAVVAATAAAAPGWRDTSLARRSAVLFAYRELLHARRDELAALVTAEHGKTLPDAAGEVLRGLDVVGYACGLPSLLRGSFSENVSTGVDSYSVRQPVGVVAVVSPFNFPVMVPLWFVPVAVACGNAVVLKPSEKDPGPPTLLARWFAEAGLPDGVLNVVHGDAEAVDALLEHPRVAAVSFVGSTPVARHVYQRGTAAGKRVQALGGAKNHLVVLPDADLELAAEQATSAGFGSAGERCMAVSAVVAVEPVGDQLVTRIAERMAGIRTGDGRRPECQMGPLVTAAHRDRVTGYVEAGVAAGATVVVDGRGVQPAGDPGGFWLGPTLFDRVTPDMSIYTDEIFGPVLSVLRASSYEEAVGLVNANPYGNGAAIFTRDGGAARRFQREAEAGMIGVNVPIPVPMAYYSFGGWKSSLFGDLHAHGADGVQFYTRGKVVTTRWSDPSHRGLSLGFPTQQ